MNIQEAEAWMNDKRSTTNFIQSYPEETWEGRIAQADAAYLEQAYWVLRYRKIDCPESGIMFGGACDNCKKPGKIKVYTEQEVQKLIKQEREEILNIFENYKDERDFYTWGEVQEAIKQREKEEAK